MSIMQKLYDSEINASISTFWDGGFDVKLGDPMNGFDNETTVKTFAEAEAWLAETAALIYPDSVFAKAADVPDDMFEIPGIEQTVAEAASELLRSERKA